MPNALKNIPLSALFGLSVIILICGIGLFANILAPYGETEVVGAQYEPWGPEFWLGTDNLGRDLLSRMIYGARNTVGLALLTTALAFSIGSFLGILSALKGGWPDLVLGRLVDILMSVPPLILALMLLALTGTSLSSMVAVIAVIYLAPVFRLSRAAAQSVVVMDYVEAARLRGEGTGRLIWQDILPNITPTLIAEFGLRFCFVFLFIAALSFLGLGIQPPTADWGGMVRDNAVLISFGDLTPLIPAGAIALLTVSINLVVDWMLHRASGLKETTS